MGEPNYKMCLFFKKKMGLTLYIPSYVFEDSRDECKTYHIL